MAARHIVLAGISAEAARIVGEHAGALGAELRSVAAREQPPAGGGAATLVLVPADAVLAARGEAGAANIVVVGHRVDVEQQARALEGGAIDVIDLAWSPAMVVLRLRRLFEREDLRGRLASDLAAKQRELADARTLQLALVPPAGGDDRIAINVVLEPAMELGGDLVDYVRIADGRYMLALGDVSGKGAAAALTMARTHTLLRSLALRSYAGDLLSPPDTAARRLNGMLAIDNEGCMFVTMFLALLDPASGELDYVRCGQIPPFLRRRDGAIERLDEVGGPPLGVIEDIDYAVGHTRLAPGDALLVVSDGVTEAEAHDGRLLGEAPVLGWLEAARDELASLVAIARAHENGGAPSDDLSAILVRLR